MQKINKNKWEWLHFSLQLCDEFEGKHFFISCLVDTSRKCSLQMEADNKNNFCRKKYYLNFAFKCHIYSLQIPEDPFRLGKYIKKNKKKIQTLILFRPLIIPEYHLWWWIRNSVFVSKIIKKVKELISHEISKVLIIIYVIMTNRNFAMNVAGIRWVASLIFFVASRLISKNVQIS